MHTGPVPIAIIIGQLHQGGSERQLYYFLQQCDRLRWRPHVFVSASEGAGQWVEPIRRLEMPICQLAGSKASKMLQLRRKCVSQGIRTIVSWSSYTNIYGLALVGQPVNRVGSFRSAGFNELPGRARGIWTWLSVRSVTTIICNSDETAAEVQRCISNRQHVVCVPNAVEPPTDVAQSRTLWRQRLDVRDDEVLVAGVGSLKTEKNFARFIDAIAIARPGRPLRAVIAGRDMGERDALREHLRRSALPAGTITLLDDVPDARELLCAADILLLSSDVEGMPNVVMEAMAVGVPTVATPVNGLSRLIRSGHDGLITAPTPAALAEGLVTLADDELRRTEMGSRARCRMHQFSPAMVYDKVWSSLSAAEAGVA